MLILSHLLYLILDFQSLFHIIKDSVSFLDTSSLPLLAYPLVTSPPVLSFTQRFHNPASIVLDALTLQQ